MLVKQMLVKQMLVKTNLGKTNVLLEKNFHPNLRFVG
jgi:hypothetical protein